MKDTAYLGKKIKQLRLSNDLSLRDLAEKSGVSFSFISSVEKDRYHASRETIIALAEVLEGANKNELLLLAGFAPDNEPLISSALDQTADSEIYIAYLGGPPKELDEEEAQYLEKELEEFRKFKARRKKEREEQNKNL